MRIVCFIFLFTIAHQIVFAQDFKHAIAQHREKYKADFIANAHAPLKAEDFKFLDFFAADPLY